MIFLLDSNVISELRKTRPHGAALAWLKATRPEEIGIPAIVLEELQAGAEICLLYTSPEPFPPGPPKTPPPWAARPPSAMDLL